MKQRWAPLGNIFGPEHLPGWAKSHASVPLVQNEIRSTVNKVFFSSRDAQGRSVIGSFQLDLSGSPRIYGVSQTPYLVPGSLGAFDDDGVMASCFCQVGDETFLYYIGWNRGVSVPFRNSIGLARATGSGHFSRVFEGPILDRTPLEPHFVASCFVMEEPLGLFRMWYLSCVGWDLHAGNPRHRYHIKYAESEDGIVWDRTGRVAIDFQTDSEYAISRPWVLKDGDRWKMWYSYRGERYQIGYAESSDGLRWERMDHLVSLPQAGTWDSTMVEYPCVFDADGKRWMIYNGNGFGLSGIGIAELLTE